MTTHLIIGKDVFSKAALIATRLAGLVVDIEYGEALQFEDLQDPKAALMAIGRHLRGDSEIDQEKVVQLISTAHTITIQQLNEILMHSTYLVDSYASVADLVMFAAKHTTMLSMSIEERSKVPNFVRWFEHIQRLEPVRQLSGLQLIDHLTNPSPIYSIDFLQIEHQKTATPKVEKAAKKDVRLAETEPAPVSANIASITDTSTKKEKKAKMTSTIAPATSNTVPLLSRFEIRVGRILSAKSHPGEARFLVLEVDVGRGEEPRIVVSGLADHFKSSELQDKLVAVVTNLKPGDMKGVVSAGRLLIATSTSAPTHKELCLAPSTATVGDRISVAEIPESTLPDLPYVSSKHQHEILKHFSTDSNKRVCWKGALLLTTLGGHPLSTETIVNGTVA